MKIIFIFFIYAFGGWIWECIFESIRNHKILNRGFLSGPYIPIYGFGGTAAYIVLNIFYSDKLISKNSIYIFLIGLIGATILEYITAVILEHTFGTSWWDYSDFPLNYKGRICIAASLFWGIIAIVCIQKINPFIFDKLDYIPHDIQLILCSCLITAISIDTLHTLTELIDFKEKLKIITTKQISQIDEIHARVSPTIQRIVKAFPQFKFKSNAIQETYVRIKTKWKNTKIE